MRTWATLAGSTTTSRRTSRPGSIAPSRSCSEPAMVHLLTSGPVPAWPLSSLLVMILPFELQRKKQIQICDFIYKYNLTDCRRLPVRASLRGRVHSGRGSLGSHHRARRQHPTLNRFFRKIQQGVLQEDW